MKRLQNNSKALFHALCNLDCEMPVESDPFVFVGAGFFDLSVAYPAIYS
jgi:hypothetical protein